MYEAILLAIEKKTYRDGWGMKARGKA